MLILRAVKIQARKLLVILSGCALVSFLLATTFSCSGGGASSDGGEEETEIVADSGYGKTPSKKTNIHIKDVEEKQDVIVADPVPTPSPTPIPNTPPEITANAIGTNIADVVLGKSLSIPFTATDTDEDLGTVTIFYSTAYQTCDAATETNWTLANDDLTFEDTSYEWTPTTAGRFFICVKANDGKDSVYDIGLWAINVIPSDMQLWLKADTGITLNGATVSSWADQSGNEHHATMDTVAYQPEFIEAAVNDLPVIRFDGVDDHFKDAHAYTARMVFSVQMMNSTTQDSADLAQIWGDYTSGVHVALDPRGGDQTFSFDGSGGARGRYAFGNGSFSSSFIANGADTNWKYDAFEILTTEFEADMAITEQTLAHLSHNFSVGQHHFGGNLGELIVFDRVLTEEELDAIQSYLIRRWQGEQSTDPSPEPTDLSSTATSDTKIKLSWNSGGGTTTGYQISYAQGSAAPENCMNGNIITSVAIGSNTTFTITELSANTEYAFRVCSVNNGSIPPYLSPGITTTGITLANEPEPPQANLILWLSADVGVSVDASNHVTGWADRTASGFDASQTNTDYQPVLIENAQGGHPVIQFDGNNDFLEGAHSVDARSVFVVFKVNSSYQDAGELGQLWGEYNGIGHVAADPRSGNLRGFSFDGNTNTTANFGLDGATFSGPAEDSNAQQWSYDTYHIITAEFTNMVNPSLYMIGNLWAPFDVGQHHFGGEIAEILVYSDVLSAEDRSAVELYLQGKWSL